MAETQNLHREMADLEGLTALRKEAEGHLARAREALFDDTVSDADALSHLDAALASVTAMIPERDKGDVKAA